MGRINYLFGIKRETLNPDSIDDGYWVSYYDKGKIKIPVINTAQPRVYHICCMKDEIYHLFYDLNLRDETHNITVVWI